MWQTSAEVDQEGQGGQKGARTAFLLHRVLDSAIWASFLKPQNDQETCKCEGFSGSFWA